MSKRPEVLAVIPARGGSKGIPRKNVKLLGGWPLIAYSIAAGLQARSVTRTIVTTDDDESATVAHQFGAEVPFIRPAALAGDDVTDFPVFEHALSWLEENEGYRPEIVVQLRPTSPFRPPGLVDEAVEALRTRPDSHSCRTVTPSGENPFKMWTLDGHHLKPLLDLGFPEPYNMPRQKLPATYWQTGHVDAFWSRTILTMRTLTGSVVLPVLVGRPFSVDLDTPEDWDYAEWILTHRRLDVIRPLSAVTGAQRRGTTC